MSVPSFGVRPSLSLSLLVFLCLWLLFMYGVLFAAALVDPLAMLGVDKDATLPEIKRAFKAKALQVHPDKGGTEEEFVNLRAAYDTVTGHDAETWRMQTQAEQEQDSTFDDFFSYFDGRFRESHARITLYMKSEGVTFEFSYAEFAKHDFDMERIFRASFDNGAKVTATGYNKDGEGITPGGVHSHVAPKKKHISGKSSGEKKLKYKRKTATATTEEKEEDGDLESRVRAEIRRQRRVYIVFCAWMSIGLAIMFSMGGYIFWSLFRLHSRGMSGKSPPSELIAKLRNDAEDLDDLPFPMVAMLNASTTTKKDT